ncbi:type II toxin-antitoxin system HicB family antitoxin [Bradyrhizobium sp. BRP14]|nr:type II toxin-antitoxin system HicB family antitoxin [Bradyrhizobium sp. BRP14]
MSVYLALVEPGNATTAYGIVFPDLPGVHSAADEAADILPTALEALQLWAEDEDMPLPSDMAVLIHRDDIRKALAAGAFLLAVPFTRKATGRKPSDFNIGDEFIMANGWRWRVTDIGTRVVVAIRIQPVVLQSKRDGKITREEITQTEAEQDGWVDGPPYAVAEQVFDEYDLDGIEEVYRKGA